MDRPSPLIIIAGPTASGKTALAFELARTHPVEVVSADSMQVYRHMDIATAKPTEEERRQLPHHLVDVVNPDEEYHAARFVSDAETAISEIRSRGAVPLVVGGTGLYIRTLLYGLSAAPARNEALRQVLLGLERQHGEGCLHRMLSRLDPEVCAPLSPRDLHRIVRYLEIILVSGRTASELNRRHMQAPPRHEARMICLLPERQDLYARIDARVLSMFEAGLEEETNKLLGLGYAPGLRSMQTLAYKHVVAMLEGGIDREDAVRLIQRDTRRYAKRQITWFTGQHPGTCLASPSAAREQLLALLDTVR